MIKQLLISESGKWMMHGNDTIHLMNGKKIEGKLAEKYVLKKMS